MGTFTIPLKKVIEYENGKIGLDDYPIFDETYRESLNKKIIAHYWNQEIGVETPSLFRFAMARKMNEIMPLYNQHYKLSLLTVDPLSTINMRSIVESDGTTTAASNGTSGGTTTAEGEGTTGGTTTTEGEGTTAGTTTTDGNSTSESGSTSKARVIGSEFPQTILMENGDYATTGNDTISDTTATGAATDHQTVTQEGTSTDNQTVTQAGSTTDNQTVTQSGTSTESQNATQEGKQDSTTTGYQGHAPELIAQARLALVNVDMMVINELRELFMLIWSNNDTFTNNRGGYYGFGYPNF